MRTLPDALKVDIEDASIAGLLGNLPPAVAEKDFHVTDVLHELSKIRIKHEAYRVNHAKGDPSPLKVEVETRLVFAGGTCLSKAHALIERMSEDIDIKVELEATPEGYALPKGQTHRKRLGDLHDAIEQRLTEIGFTFAEGIGENPMSRDTRRYYCLAVAYQPHFQDTSGALRPELKLEIIHRPPKLPVEGLEIGYLLDRFAPRGEALSFDMACISVAETLAEKVLSLLRRCAWKWDGHQRGEFDTSLVRHVYDVWRIAQSNPDAVVSAQRIFAALVEQDTIEFKGQHPEFDERPHEVLRRALEAARSNDGLRDDFERRLKPLLFAEEKPAFDTCFSTFEAVAEALLRGIEDSSIT